MKIIPRRISKMMTISTQPNNNYGLYIESINSNKSALLLGTLKEGAEPLVLKDLVDKYAYASALLYFVENFNISNDINKKDLLEDINVLLHARCKKVEEKAPLITKIGQYPIYEGVSYILRGEGKIKIKESFNLQEDVNMDDITLEYLKNRTHDDVIKGFVVCPKCKNVYEEDALMVDYADIPDDYYGPTDDDPISYTCPYCNYYSKNEENFREAWLDDLEEAPNIGEYVLNSDKLHESFNAPIEKMDYISLDALLDSLISKNVNDTELNNFLERVANNEVISNSEYNKLVNKAQDTRRIEIKEEAGTQASDIASKVDYSFQSAPTPTNPVRKRKYEEVEIKELDESTYLNLTGFIKDVDGLYKRGNYVLVKEAATGELKVIHKRKLKEAEEVVTQAVNGPESIVKYIQEKLDKKFPNRFVVKSGPVDNAYGLVITDKNNHDAGDLIDVTDFINSIMSYLKYDKSDYEIDYKRNSLIMAIYNQKKLYSNDFSD